MSENYLEDALRWVFTGSEDHAWEVAREALARLDADRAAGREWTLIGPDDAHPRWPWCADCRIPVSDSARHEGHEVYNATIYVEHGLISTRDTPEQEECGDCGGSGSLEEEYGYHDDPFRSQGVLVECAACSGTGRLPARDTPEPAS